MLIQTPCEASGPQNEEGCALKRKQQGHHDDHPDAVGQGDRHRQLEVIRHRVVARRIDHEVGLVAVGQYKAGAGPEQHRQDERHGGDVHAERQLVTHGEGQGRGGVVAHQLGQHQGKQVDADKGDDGAGAVELPHQPVGNQPGQPALLQLIGDGQRPAHHQPDVQRKAAADLVQGQDAGEEQHHQHHQQPLEERHQIEYRQRQHPEKAQHHGGAALAIEPGGGFQTAHHHELPGEGLVAGKLGARGQQQGVAGVQLNLAETAGELGLATAHRQHHRIEVGAKLRILDGLTHQARAVADDHLHQMLAVEAVLAVEIQPLELLQHADTLHVAAKQQHVPLVQLVFRLHRADHLVAPDDLGEIEAFEAAQAVLLDAAPGHGGTGPHLGLEKVAGFPAHLGVLLRQVTGKQQHGHQTGQQGARSHHKEVEHAERRRPHLDEEAVDDEVGGGADQGQHPAKGGCEAHGQQQPGGGMVGVAFDCPQHGGHHGGVVDEGRQEGGGEPHLD